MKPTFKMMVVGPPSGGKTTISKKLAEIFKCDHVSSGDYARSIQSQANFEALAVGDLSPDHMRIAEWVTNKVRDTPRIIVDGFPRSVEQFSSYDFRNIDVVVWLDVPVGECMSRAMGRGRLDDEAPIFWRRYMNYMKHTAPLLSDFSQSTDVSLVHYIDNGHTLDENVIALTQHINKIIGG